jgi:ribosome-associated translation inhibitor RaiA
MMHGSIEISLRGIASSGELENYIGEEVRRLEGVCDRIRSCEVLAEALRTEKRQGAQVAVRLVIRLPGTEVVVNREHGDDIFLAVRDAFAAAALQLKDHMRRHDVHHRPSSGASNSRH